MQLRRIVNQALVKLRLREPPPELSRDQALDAVPIRNPDLVYRETDSDEVAITLPRRHGRLWSVLGWVFAVPETRDITLDEIGSQVWNLCDGEHTVSDLVTALMAKHKLGRREVEVSLTQYLRDLGKRGMVGFAVPKADEEGDGPDDIAEERGAGEAPRDDDEPRLGEGAARRRRGRRSRKRKK